MDCCDFTRVRFDASFVDYLSQKGNLSLGEFALHFVEGLTLLWQPAQDLQQMLVVLFLRHTVNEDIIDQANNSYVA